MPNCKQCNIGFEIADQDRRFYQKMDVPDPAKCPACRDQNRIAFRNEAYFYKRNCDLCKKPTISVYSKDKPVTVYCLKCWWSDQYDPLAYGRDYDFNRPFFDQYYDLAKVVPKPAILNMNSENCDYTNYSTENKNCYWCSGTLRSEDCYYSDRLFYSRNVIDSYDLHKCEICYECIQCTNLYNCQFCQSADNCSDCFLCLECTGCRDCFGCINLKNKQYYIFNRPYSQEEYKKKVAELRAHPEVVRQEFDLLNKSVPHKAQHILNCENSTGDQLVNCKNCFDAYTLKNSEECRYVFMGDGDKYCCDCSTCDNCELQYNSANLEQNYDLIGGNLVWYSKNVRYVTNCFNCNDVFGCIGVKKNRYCILNKQYSKEDYEKMVQRIVEHMRSTGEWGEYFPNHHSPFAYNETVANEHFPLSKTEVLEKKWKWKEPNDDIPKTEKTIPAEKLPKSISEVPDDILNWAIKCEVTGRPFVILKQELQFYRQYDLPIPHYHPEERHKRRYSLRNPRKLFDRSCAKCQTAIKTSYSPERPEIVYCESCYLKEFY